MMSMAGHDAMRMISRALDYSFDFVRHSFRFSLRRDRHRKAVGIVPRRHVFRLMRHESDEDRSVARMAVERRVNGWRIGLGVASFVLVLAVFLLIRRPDMIFAKGGGAYIPDVVMISSAMLVALAAGFCCWFFGRGGGTVKGPSALVARHIRLAEKPSPTGMQNGESRLFRIRDDGHAGDRVGSRPGHRSPWRGVLMGVGAMPVVVVAIAVHHSLVGRSAPAWLSAAVPVLAAAMVVLVLLAFVIRRITSATAWGAAVQGWLRRR